MCRSQGLCACKLGRRRIINIVISRNDDDRDSGVLDLLQLFCEIEVAVPLSIKSQIP